MQRQKHHLDSHTTCPFFFDTIVTFVMVGYASRQASVRMQRLRHHLAERPKNLDTLHHERFLRFGCYVAGQKAKPTWQPDKFSTNLIAIQFRSS